MVELFKFRCFQASGNRGNFVVNWHGTIIVLMCLPLFVVIIFKAKLKIFTFYLFVLVTIGRPSLVTLCYITKLGNNWTCS